MEDDNLFKLIHAVEAVTNEAIVAWNEVFPHQLGISPILVLGELERFGPQNHMKLAETLGFTGGALTNIAKKLIHLELVHRKFKENDRRQILLEITPQGMSLLEEARNIGKQQHQEMFQVLSEEEVAQYLSINKKLLNSLKTKKAKR